MATTHNLFGSSVYKTRIDPASYDKKQIIKTMMDNYAINPIRNKWNDVSNIHHTYLDWDNTEFLPIDYSSLVPVYQKHIDEFMNTVAFSSNFQYNWNILNFSINAKDMTEHDHFYSNDKTVTMFSCTHYISFDKEIHKPTEFINSSPVVFFTPNVQTLHKVLDSSNENNSMYYSSWSLDTNEDDFIIFPAHQKHAVYPARGESDIPRIVSAVNIEINLK